MPTTSSSSPPPLSSPGSSTGTVSSLALSTPPNSTSPSIPLVDAPTTTSSGNSRGSVVSRPTTLHKRAPPSSNPPAPASPQQMHNAHSPPSSGNSSSSHSTPTPPNKLIKRDHPTLGTLHDIQPSANKHQGNRLRKPMHSRDSHKVGPSFNDHDAVDPDAVLLADNGPLPAAVNPPPCSATNSQVPSTTHQATTSTKTPQRPEVVRQQSYSKRHASFDTPRTEIPLPFFSEPFPRELEWHQQKCSESDELPSPTRHSRVLPLPIPTSATAQSICQVPSLNRNNSAPTPPSSPCPAPTNVQDLKETESLRDRVERESEQMGPWPSIVPSSITPPSSDESIGRRSTASLPLPDNHTGEPLYQLEVAPSTSRTFLTSSALHPLAYIPAPSIPAPASAFALPPPPPPATPEISTPPTTLHPPLDILASASSSASNTPPQAHASVSTQSSATPPPSASTSTSATTSTSHPTMSTIVNSPPLPPPPSTATTITTGPQGPHMTVQTTSTAYILTTFLPGYQRDEITLSTRKRRVLHVVADPFISSRGTGHFERRISFGYDVDMVRIRAEFNGGVLKIIVPRRPTVSAPAGYDSKVGTGGQQGDAWGTYGQ